MARDSLQDFFDVARTGLGSLIIGMPMIFSFYIYSNATSFLWTLFYAVPIALIHSIVMDSCDVRFSQLYSADNYENKSNEYLRYGFYWVRRAYMNWIQFLILAIFIAGFRLCNFTGKISFGFFWIFLFSFVLCISCFLPLKFKSPSSSTKPFFFVVSAALSIAYAGILATHASPNPSGSSDFLFSLFETSLTTTKLGRIVSTFCMASLLYAGRVFDYRHYGSQKEMENPEKNLEDPSRVLSRWVLYLKSFFSVFIPTGAYWLMFASLRGKGEDLTYSFTTENLGNAAFFLGIILFVFTTILLGSTFVLTRLMYYEPFTYSAVDEPKKSAQVPHMGYTIVHTVAVPLLSAFFYVAHQLLVTKYFTTMAALIGGMSMFISPGEVLLNGAPDFVEQDNDDGGERRSSRFGKRGQVLVLSFFVIAVGVVACWASFDNLVSASGGKMPLTVV